MWRAPLPCARQVKRLQAAHHLFKALDASDRRIDGCVTAVDLTLYLVDQAGLRAGEAADLSRRVLWELGLADQAEPLCFIQVLLIRICN